MRQALVAIGIAGAVLAALPAPQAHASNTATSRSFTSEWTCENGRQLLINAHPRRPREEAWLTYLGKRVEMFLQKSAPGEPIRLASKDNKVVWVRMKDTSMLQFDELLPQPVTCTLVAKTLPKPTK